MSEKLAQIGDEAYANRDEPIPGDAKVTLGHNRSCTLQVRLNDEEYAALEAAAEDADLPMSTLVRSLVLRQLEPRSAQAIDTPKMPGEPPRVQPSRINPANWNDAAE